jgi:hypothetical protein
MTSLTYPKCLVSLKALISMTCLTYLEGFARCKYPTLGYAGLGILRAMYIDMNQTLTAIIVTLGLLLSGSGVMPVRRETTTIQES